MLQNVATTLVSVSALLPLIMLGVQTNVLQAQAPATEVSTRAGRGIWPGEAKCAVSLSYDDSIPVHHRHVAPLLEQNGLRGTFYLSVRMIDKSDAWKVVAARGHELGNHSLFHPCRKEATYTWLSADYDLKRYSPARFRDELLVADLVLDLLDGGRPRTYGNNCVNLTIGEGDLETPMDPILAELFVAARGTITGQPVDPAEPAFTRLGHFGGDGKTFEEIRAEIELARARGGWIIFMFHGVGEGTHALFIEEEEHRQLVEWLGRQRASIWTAPVVDVALHLKGAVQTREVSNESGVFSNQRERQDQRRRPPRPDSVSVGPPHDGG